MVGSSTERLSLARRLGRNIAARRTTMGLTQVALAERLGIEPESVSRCERGKTLPSLTLLEQIALALRVTAADLLAECPEDTYPEAQRLSAMLSRLGPDQRATLVEVIEKLCSLMAMERGRGA